MNLHVLIPILMVILTYIEGSPEESWGIFKKKFNKAYGSGVEPAFRSAYLHNDEEIRKHNRLFEQGKLKWKRGHNKYSDVPAEIFNTRMKGYKPSPRRHGLRGNKNKYLTKEMINRKDLPASVDWREKGAVSSVKDQGFCGSCYTFAAAGALEGVMTIVYNETVLDLSNQEILDCSSYMGSAGCNGGTISAGYRYATWKSGLLEYSAYPYIKKSQQCRAMGGKRHARIMDYEEIPTGDEQALKAAVALFGPVGVGFDSRNLLTYKTGIYEDPKCNPNARDHGVLVVGYGTENGQDYWICKNSWGPTFGENGYFKIARNKNSHCGIAHDALFPIAKSK